jgi:prolyl oligopeptidase
VPAVVPEPALPGVTDTIFGVQVRDPYRHLETLTPETSAWIDAQSQRTISSLQSWGFYDVQSATTPFFVNGTIMEPQVSGGQIFYTKREGYQQQPLVYVTSPVQPIRAVFDPAQRSARTALDWYFPSPRGRYVALGVSDGGTERSVLEVLDVRSGAIRDRIERTRWGTVAWLASEDGFYYTRYPNPGERGFDPAHEDAYFNRVFFHRLGTDPASDPLVFESPDGADFPTMSLSDDDRWLAITNFRGWFESDVWMFDRGADPAARISAPTAERPLTPVIVRSRSMTHVTVRRGQLYLLTNEGSSSFRIDRVQAERAADRSAWVGVIPPTDVPINAWLVAGDKLVLNTIEDVHSRLYVHSIDGTRLRELELPDIGEVEGIAADANGNEVVAVFSSYTTPPSVYGFDLASGARRMVDRVACSLDLSRYHVTRERVRSADGTSIPVTLVHSGTTLVRDSNQPVLLYGYGGFADSFLPSFRTDALYWVSRGGIYAVANIRGGGEFGEAWHRGGSMENKVRSFEDFEAAIRWLSDSGVSRPERIAITGDSNGGLLIGAMITRVPESFRAAIGNVGLYDMVRYTRFPPAELWVTEYGNPEVEREFRFLLDYSPYHRVTPRAYPWVLIETAEEDNRVHWSHSTKFAAHLQASNTSQNPIFFFMARGAGHGSGLGGFGLGDRYARGFTFAEKALGMR